MFPRRYGQRPSLNGLKDEKTALPKQRRFLKVIVSCLTIAAKIGRPLLFEQ